MEYLIRLTQTHEDFRVAELQALAVLSNVQLKILLYRPDSPFCLVKLPTEEAAIKLVQRSILAKAIYEIWGKGDTYDALHENVQRVSSRLWPAYKNVSFKFLFDSFQAKRSVAEQRELINGFSYFDFQGPIKMSGAEQEFCIFEEWKLDANSFGNSHLPDKIYLGRYLGGSDRDIIQKFDLKKRRYICTTSMDAELALVTANIALAAPGKLFYDPFVGSGSFPIACAYFGSLAFGSDIDGRSIRGKGDRNLKSNFDQYSLQECLGDSFVADVTNNPLRKAKLFDGIVCDPPYGVREGLKVLGSRNPAKRKEPIILNGKAHYTLEDYIPPKRPYSFLNMIDDILDFAANTLVENGRLSFWMPLVKDEGQEFNIPEHSCLKLTSVCTQHFSKWSRRLITYCRVPDLEVVQVIGCNRIEIEGRDADELNPFRKSYFQGFKSKEV